MLKLTVTPDADYFDVLDIYQRDQSTPTQFLLSDVLTCNFFQGNETAPLFNPAVSWNTINVSFNFTLTNAQTTTLDANATYRCQVFATRASVTVCIADFLVQTTPSAGIQTESFLTYCTYKDMLDIAPWVEGVQDVDSGIQGFYTQRLLARNWMDAAILNAYRGAFVGLFEMHSYAAFAFGYAGWRRSLGPAPSMSTYLEQNLLMLARSDGSPTQIVRCCALRAIGEVGMGQLGGNNAFYQYGLMNMALARNAMFSTTAEINLSGTGTDVGNLFVNLGSTNTLMS